MLSRAGSLPHEIVGVVGNLRTTSNPVGVGLLTKAAGQANFLCLTHCLREQARSHIRLVGLLGLLGIWGQHQILWEWGCREFADNVKPCGSGLAHEGGGSGEFSVSDLMLSRAGSLPHEIVGVVGNLRTTSNPVGVGLLTNAAGQASFMCLTHCLREQARSHMRLVGCRESGDNIKSCGSGLAHESGGSGEFYVSDLMPSRASPLPHEIGGVVGNLRTTSNPVGVGLLTKAAGHAEKMSTGRALSRAGSLQQGSSVFG